MAKKSLTDRDLEILLKLNAYDRLTIKQVLRVLDMSEKSYTTLSTRLADLKELGYLGAISYITKTTFAGMTKVYYLTAKGRRIIGKMEEPEIEVTPRPKVEEIDPTEIASLIYWRHHFAVNDFLITADVWRQRNTEDVTLEGALTMFDIDRRKDFPVPITMSDGRKATMSPDGWLDVMVSGQEYCFALELERDQYSEKRWGDKIERMLGFYDVNAASDMLRFLIIAMKGEEHKKQILRVTAQTLREIQRSDAAPLFLVTETEPTDLRLFTDPVWMMPNVYAPQKLF